MDPMVIALQDQARMDELIAQMVVEHCGEQSTDNEEHYDMCYDEVYQYYETFDVTYPAKNLKSAQDYIYRIRATENSDKYNKPKRWGPQNL